MAEKKKKKDDEIKKENDSVKEEDKKESTEKEQKEEKESEAVILAKELANTKDKLLRTLAEYDNFRKRSQKEKEAIYSDSKADVISKILPVLDNFERAASNTQADFDAYKKGVEMIVSQLLDSIKSLGVEAFGEAGDEFDPNFHNAVMHIEDENLGENTVADVFMKGYKLGEKVLRPATVKVAN